MAMYFYISERGGRGGRRGGGINKKTKSKQNTNRTCYQCKEKGHIAKDCEKRKAEEAEKVLAAGGTEPPVETAEVVELRKQLEDTQKKLAEATEPKST